MVSQVKECVGPGTGGQDNKVSGKRLAISKLDTLSNPAFDDDPFDRIAKKETRVRLSSALVVVDTHALLGIDEGNILVQVALVPLLLACMRLESLAIDALENGLMGREMAEISLGRELSTFDPLLLQRLGRGIFFLPYLGAMASGSGVGIDHAAAVIVGSKFRVLLDQPLRLQGELRVDRVMVICANHPCCVWYSVVSLLNFDLTFNPLYRGVS